MVVNLCLCFLFSREADSHSQLGREEDKLTLQHEVCCKVHYLTLPDAKPEANF